METLVHAKEKQLLTNWVNLFRINLDYSLNPAACEWFASQLCRRPWVKNIFLNCSVVETRQQVCHIITNMFLTMAPYDRKYYFIQHDPDDIDGMKSEEIKTKNFETDNVSTGDDSSNSSDEKESAQLVDSSNDNPKSLLERFVMVHLNLIPSLLSHWRNFSEYFLILYQISCFDDAERELLIRRKTIARLVDFYLGDESPLRRSRSTTHKSKKMRMGDKFQPCILGYMFKLLSHLIRGSIVPESKKQSPLALKGSLFPLTKIDQELIFSGIFITKLLKEAEC
eukprot:c38149_g1_i1.p1 GENE.c38149_g1_i1~~c38149_g1_i1.p1  ORF type:complete len:282 (-),score=80.63 c38149_g1_i1:156-1001(-)